MEDDNLKKFNVNGYFMIPFNFSTWNKSKKEAWDKTSILLNSRNITLIDSDIYTVDGNSHPFIAEKCSVELLEVLGEDDI